MALLSFFDSKECEWSDMTLYIEGVKLTKIVVLKYKSSKEKEALHAAGDMPISIQGGNRTYTGNLKILKGALDDLNTAARAAGGKDALDISFTVVVTYRAKGTRPLRTDTLKSVEITDFEKGWEQGAKNMPIECPIMFLDEIDV